ncbi:MAG: phage portal protein family protein, partial [Geminicoccaceae bacterium]
GLIRKPMVDFVTNHIRGSDTGLLLDSSVYTGGGEDETPIKAEKFGVELLSGGSYGHKEISEAIERINREIARVLGVEQLLLGADSAGSLALSRDKSQAFFMVVNAALTELKTSFRSDLIDPLWILNGFDEELKPELDFESVEFKDPEQISKVIKDLATSGVPIEPEDDLVDELLAVVGLSGLNHKLREEKMQARLSNAKLGLDENGLPLPGGSPFNQAPQGGSGSPAELSGNLPGVDPGGSADDALRAQQGRQAAARSQARPSNPTSSS